MAASASDIADWLERLPHFFRLVLLSERVSCGVLLFLIRG